MIQALIILLISVSFLMGGGLMFVIMIQVGYVHPEEILEEDKKEFNWDTYCTICFSETNVIKHTLELCPKCSNHILRSAIDYRGN